MKNDRKFEQANILENNEIRVLGVGHYEKMPVYVVPANQVTKAKGLMRDAYFISRQEAENQNTVQINWIDK
jgi:hypothetical protein